MSEGGRRESVLGTTEIQLEREHNRSQIATQLNYSPQVAASLQVSVTWPGFGQLCDYCRPCSGPKPSPVSWAPVF